MKIALGNDHAG